MLESARKQIGYVYFLQSDAHELVKIGVTNNVKKRIESIQIGCPCPLVLAGIITKATWDAARALESRLHRHFAEQRVRGEWFRLDSNTVAEIIEQENATPSPNDRASKPLNRLSVEDKIEQEAEWQDDGRQAYYDGLSKKDFPIIGKKGSNVYYRAKSAWQAGWIEGSAEKYVLKPERRTWLPR